MPPPVQRYGVVVAASTGASIGGVEIRSIRGVRLATTGADGLFELADGHSQTDQLVEVRSQGFGLRLVDLKSGDPARPDRIELLAGANLFGFVDGLGEAGVVRARADSFGLVDDKRSLAAFVTHEACWYGPIEESGRYELDGLPPRVPLEIRVITPDKNGVLKSLPDRVELDPGEARRLDIHFGGGARIVGRVLERSGQGASRLSVELHAAGRGRPAGSRARAAVSVSAEDGGFLFEDVAPGEWSVGLESMKIGFSDEMRYAGAWETVQVVGSSDVEVTVTIDRGLYVDGRVVFDGEAPPVGATCYGFDSKGQLVVAKVERDGRFRAGPLPAGTVRLSAQASQGRDSSPLIAPSEEASFEAGAKDVVLTLRQGGAVRFTAIDPVSGETIPARFALNTGEKHPRGTLKEENDFFAKGLPLTTAAVHAVTADGRAGLVTDVTIQGGVEGPPVAIPVEPAGFLNAICSEGPGSLQYCVLRGSAQVAAGAVAPGKAQRVSLPPGDYVLRLTRREGQGDQSRTLETDDRGITVTVGEALDLAL